MMQEEPILDFVVPGAFKEPSPEEHKRTQAQIEWQGKAQYCQSKIGHHDWLPISSIKTPTAEHVTVLMCKACFHTINISEMYAHR